MEIVLSDFISYCSGVALAIKKMNKAIDWAIANNKKVYSLGNLIHNERVISRFEDKGVEVLEEDNLQSVEPGIIVLRAHGVKESLIRLLLKRGFIIVDATCPIVLRERTLIKEADEKYHIIVIGKEKHPEAVFLYSVETPHKKTLVSSVEDLEKIPLNVPLFVVIQSTFNQEKVNAIIKELRLLEKEGREIVVANSLCSSTNRRRASVKKLVDECECVIVVGGSIVQIQKVWLCMHKNSGQRSFLSILQKSCLKRFILTIKLALRPEPLHRILLLMK